MGSVPRVDELGRAASALAPRQSGQTRVRAAERAIPSQADFEPDGVAQSDGTIQVSLDIAGLSSVKSRYFFGFGMGIVSHPFLFLGPPHPSAAYARMISLALSLNR